MCIYTYFPNNISAVVDFSNRQKMRSIWAVDISVLPSSFRRLSHVYVYSLPFLYFSSPLYILFFAL